MLKGNSALPQNPPLSANEQNKRYAALKAVLDYFYHDHTRSGAHCRYNLKYHIVWIPKYRRKVLTGAVVNRLKSLFKEIAAQYGLYIIAQEIMPDHVHMLVETPPKLSPAFVVQAFKSISSNKIRKEFHEHVRKFIWKEGVLWAKGYYIASIADGATTEIVREYIETQHEREGTKEKEPNLPLPLFPILI